MTEGTIRNGVPFCLDATAGVALVNEIEEKIARDSAQGTSSDVTLLVVVGLPKQGELPDEFPFVSVGGTREWVQNRVTMHEDCVKALGILEIAVQLAEDAAGFPWGSNADGVGLPNLDGLVERLAMEIEAFSHGPMGRDYGLALIRPHCGMIFLNGRPCHHPGEKVDMLRRIIKEVEAGRFRG